MLTQWKKQTLKMEKEVQGRQEETAVADGASGYRVESQGFSGAPVKKRTSTMRTPGFVRNILTLRARRLTLF